MPIEPTEPSPGQTSPSSSRRRPEGWKDFHGPNAAYVLDLHDRYSRNRLSVDAATRAFFDSWTPVDRTPMAQVEDSGKLVAAVNLAQAIREYGHLAARLDPLGSSPMGDPALEVETYGLTADELSRLPASIVGGFVAERSRNALEAIEALRRIYSQTIGYDYAHVRDPQERAWLRHAAESRRFHPSSAASSSAHSGPFSPVKVLERLTQVEVFERFLQGAFPGKTRFSIEGLDVMVVLLDEVILAAAGAGISSILIGMAHRGRLNVLAHVLGKPYAQILAEFKDPVEGRDVSLDGDLGWTGDVKYHMGASRALRGGTLGGGPPGGEAQATAALTISMVPNPSHLEYVNPVVQGMARAVGTFAGDPGAPRFNPGVSLPVLIHGDASFPGQGVVAETFNFSRLEGYTTGGTLHIIANNQLGFTTNVCEARSALYSSDLAKGFEVPVVHVNADDPEASIEAIRLASAYRTRFQKDFVVDLVGYRRHGHNEGDEPRFTQPETYEIIERHPTARELWARTLLERGLIDPALPESLVRERQEELQSVLASLRPAEAIVEPLPASPPPGAARRVKTAVPAERLKALHASLSEIPGGFTIHPRLLRILERRRKALDDPEAPSIDWGLAESLALASILEDGTAIRLTGEDVERGTFSHRHAKYHDATTGRTLVPLQALKEARAAFEVVNSPLSECAAVGFEYGYAVERPDRLVIWEAQYGDFVNVAQVMIDEFLLSARAKWGQTPSLVLLLPHGYEGQGPDHSSARLERFLDLAADINLRVANPTTAAQYFHLLRRQATLLKVDPLPLVVLTPKSLLRHPAAASSLADLAGGTWQYVIDDPLIQGPAAKRTPAEVRRLVLVSGKVFVDLASSPERERRRDVALSRVEQLYPIHAEHLESLFAGYPSLEEIVWLQEEPENMGAWRHILVKLSPVIRGRWRLRYMGRPPSSSPAEGSPAWHALNQQAIVDGAFKLEGGGKGDAPPAGGRGEKAGEAAMKKGAWS